MTNQTDPRWGRSGWGHRVVSQDELFQVVFRIGSLQRGRRYVWRGVTDARWRIRSSLLRAMLAEPDCKGLPTEVEMRLRERAILREARAWGLALGPTGFLPDLHLLANLQHHRVPTRLLDVTTNPLTALWFACQPAPPDPPDAPPPRDTAAALLAFDVTEVPTYESLSFGSPTFASIGDPAGWSLHYALEVSARDRQPFLVRPTLRDARMQAQDGMFLAGAVPMPPFPPPAGVDGFDLALSSSAVAERLKSLLDKRTPGRPVTLPFCVVVIPSAVKKQVLAHLEGTYDRRLSTLFPDMAGYADAVRQNQVDLTPPADPEPEVL